MTMSDCLKVKSNVMLEMQINFLRVHPTESILLGTWGTSHCHYLGKSPFPVPVLGAFLRFGEDVCPSAVQSYRRFPAGDTGWEIQSKRSRAWGGTLRCVHHWVGMGRWLWGEGEQEWADSSHHATWPGVLRLVTNPPVPARSSKTIPLPFLYSTLCTVLKAAYFILRNNIEQYLWVLHGKLGHMVILQHYHIPANIQKQRNKFSYLAMQVGAYSINKALKCIIVLSNCLKIMFFSFRHPKP